MASLIYDTGFISFKVQLPNLRDPFLRDADDMFSLAKKVNFQKMNTV